MTDHWASQNMYDMARKRAEDAEKAGGFCDKHKPNGGARNCLVCGCERLSHALSRIDYALGPPNGMGVSDYDLHYDEEAVVKRVENLSNTVRTAIQMLGPDDWAQARELLRCAFHWEEI